MVLSLWKGLVENGEPAPVPKPSMKVIAAEIADKYGLTLADLQGPETRREISRPRQEAMARIYATGFFSYPQVGRFFGGRDHTTVLFAVRRVAEREAA